MCSQSFSFGVGHGKCLDPSADVWELSDYPLVVRLRHAANVAFGGKSDIAKRWSREHVALAHD